MNVTFRRTENTPIADAAAGFRPLTIAILAMGGQGGGVLANWIVALAEANGWIAQSTSVPGVAQRTGATIYYVEIIPARTDAQPVLALMPMPGDVDVVLAAEWMEGGRAMLRGLSTPDRTTFITSTHRSLAVGEKEKPGDGTGDPAIVADALKVAAKRIIAFDMARLAEKNGSVISAALFGALAASGVLPFSRAAFESAVRAGSVGVEASLRTFDASFSRTQSTTAGAVEMPPASQKSLVALPAKTGHAALDFLVKRIRDEIPPAAQAMAYAGVKRLVEWQDAAYADFYLDKLTGFLRPIAAIEPVLKDEIAIETARYLAVAMGYDDIFRVADLKIRGERFDRIRDDMGVKDNQLLSMTEFMHPRMEEFCSVLPARWGHAIESRPRLFKFLDGFVNKGRRVQTAHVRWYLALYCVAGLKKFRLGALRHEREMTHIDHWLATAGHYLPEQPRLALEIIKARRLVKGYSDTHARGMSKFDKVLSATAMVAGRADAGDWIRRLVAAALQDEQSAALDGALKTIAEFSGQAPPLAQ